MEIYSDRHVQVTDKILKSGEKVYQIASLSGTDIIHVPTARNILGVVPLYFGFLLWAGSLIFGILAFWVSVGWIVPAFALVGAGWPLVRAGTDSSTVYMLRADVDGTKRVLAKDADRVRLETISRALENAFSGTMEAVTLPATLTAPVEPAPPAPASKWEPDTSNHVKLPPWLSWSLGGAVFGFLGWVVWASFSL